MKKMTQLTCLLFLTLTSLSINAQIDSEEFSQIIKKEPSVEINLGSAMLGLLSSATKNDDKSISSLLSSLNGINVVVFDLDEADKLNEIRTQINSLVKLKTKQGFAKIASVKDDDSLVYILAETDDNSFKRLSIYALDDEDELVLIEIKGSILITQIGDLMQHFDVDLDINGLDLAKDKKKQQ